MKIEQAQKAKFDPRFVLRVTLIARINPSDNGAKMELRIIGSLGASKMELWFGLVLVMECCYGFHKNVERVKVFGDPRMTSGASYKCFMS